MAFTFEPTSTDPSIKLISRVRNHLSDVAVDDPESQLLQDERIQTFLNDYDQDVRLAAAAALRAIASDQALLLKVIKTLELETDGSKVSASLLAHAKALRDEVLGERAELQKQAQILAATRPWQGQSCGTRRVDGYSQLDLDENGR